MRARAVPEWMSNEMARLTMKLERYKPTGSGYNRIQPIRLSKSVTQMLNNPLPVAANQIGHSSNCQKNREICRPKGVLSRSESEWEEVYPTVIFKQYTDQNDQSPSVAVAMTAGTVPTTNIGSTGSNRSFAHYRNCSTRIT